MENETKTPLQRAQDKFKRVGTKLNEQEQAKFNEILEREGVNQSQYIKGLIFGDKTHYEELSELQKEIVILKNENTDLKNEKHKKNLENENLKKQIQDLENDISQIEKLGFWDIVRLRFFSK